MHVQIQTIVFSFLIVNQISIPIVADSLNQNQWKKYGGNSSKSSIPKRVRTACNYKELVRLENKFKTTRYSLDHKRLNLALSPKIYYHQRLNKFSYLCFGEI